MTGLFIILLFSGFVIVAFMHDKVKFWQGQALLWREKALTLERRLNALKWNENSDRNND